MTADFDDILNYQAWSLIDWKNLFVATSDSTTHLFYLHNIHYAFAIYIWARVMYAKLYSCVLKSCDL